MRHRLAASRTGWRRRKRLRRLARGWLAARGDGLPAARAASALRGQLACGIALRRSRASRRCARRIGCGEIGCGGIAYEHAAAASSGWRRSYHRLRHARGAAARNRAGGCGLQHHLRGAARRHRARSGAIAVAAAHRQRLRNAALAGDGT